MARTFERQVIEFHVRVALLNRLSQIDRPQTAAVARVRPGLGLWRREIDLCSKATSDT
jgi:hypothetical protein